MNILVIHNFYTQYGGEDKVVEEQIQLLIAAGNNVYLFSKKSSCIDKKSKLKILLDAYNSGRCQEELSKILKEFRPDIAHIHNVLPLVSPGIYKTLADHKIPIVQTKHNYRFICPNGLMFNKGLICTQCLRKNNYYFCGINKCYRNNYFFSFWYADIISKAYKKGFFNKIDRIITLNQFTRSLLEQKESFRDKTVEIPNFINQSFPKPLYKKENYVLYIGRLSKEKGIKTLLKAMQGIDDTALKIVGDGDMRDEIFQFMNENNIKNVELLGFKQGKDKDQLISYAKAVIVPSEWYEPFGLVAIEAFSRGTAVVASKIGGLQYLIDENINGLLCSAGNFLDLREKIHYIISNEDLMLEMSRNAYKTYQERYTPEIYYKKLISLYNGIIEEASKENRQCKALI